MIKKSQKLPLIFLSFCIFFSEGCMKSKTFWIEVEDDTNEIGETSDDYFSSGFNSELVLFLLKSFLRLIIKRLAKKYSFFSLDNVIIPPNWKLRRQRLEERCKRQSKLNIARYCDRWKNIHW